MAISAAVAAAIAVGTITWLIVRARGRPQENSRPAPDASRRIVSIVALGHEGSGKTVLLASMWRELAIEGARRVRVVADTPQDEVVLQGLCSEIENPESERFPPGTTLGEAKEWKFTVQARNPIGPPVDVFKFSYYDYPGELLDEMAKGREPSGAFAHALQSADIVVGILDGQMVAHLMSHGADDVFAGRLTSLCLALSRREVTTLHIMITKWDLMKGRYPLERVIARLKEFNGLFRNLLETPRVGGVRIIPVSALGTNGFVYEDKATRLMRKSATRGWFPQYVVAPLGCTIPDVLATDVQVLRDLEVNKRKPVVSRQDVSGVFFWVTLVLGLAVPLGPAPAIVSAIREIAVKGSLDKLMDSFSGVIEHARRRDPPRKLDDASGLVRALSYLREEVDRMERDIPAARLTVPGGG